MKKILLKLGFDAHLKNISYPNKKSTCSAICKWYQFQFNFYWFRWFWMQWESFFPILCYTFEWSPVMHKSCNRNPCFLTIELLKLCNLLNSQSTILFRIVRFFQMKCSVQWKLKCYNMQNTLEILFVISQAKITRAALYWF